MSTAAVELLDSRMRQSADSVVGLTQVRHKQAERYSLDLLCKKGCGRASQLISQSDDVWMDLQYRAATGVTRSKSCQLISLMQNLHCTYLDPVMHLYILVGRVKIQHVKSILLSKLLTTR